MFYVLLLLMALQRGLELLFSSSNTANLRRRGAQEVGASHYPVMVALHLAWFVFLVIERTQGATSNGSLLLLGWAFLMWGQALRWWTIRTLERRWTTRVIVLPGAPLVEAGPFRLLRHPNYLGVWLEIVGVPMIGGCLKTGIVLGLAHSALLLYRIKVEERALRDHGCLAKGV